MSVGGTFHGVPDRGISPRRGTWKSKRRQATARSGFKTSILARIPTGTMPRCFIPTPLTVLRRRGSTCLKITFYTDVTRRSIWRSCCWFTLGNVMNKSVKMEFKRKIVVHKCRTNLPKGTLLSFIWKHSLSKRLKQLITKFPAYNVSEGCQYRPQPRSKSFSFSAWPIDAACGGFRIWFSNRIPPYKPTFSSLGFEI